MTEHITFWQNSPSIHQAPLIKELAGRPGLELRVVLQSEMSSRRLDQGWMRPDYGSARVHVEPNEDIFRELLKASSADMAHIFSGVGIYPLVESAHRWLKNNATGVLIAQSEPFDVSTLARKLNFRNRARTLTAKIIDYDLILATGETGVQQWQRIARNETRVAEFGYFTDIPELVPSANENIFNIIFVGSLVKRKDPETLLRALYSLPKDNWQAKFIGDGPLRKDLMRLVERTDLESKIEFLGNVKNDGILDYLANSDVLVLPSRHDGWGAVVNEALSQGTRVLVSSEAGASALVRNRSHGAIFTPGDDAVLARLLRFYMENGLTSSQRIEIATWARASISARAAADYLLQLVSGETKGLANPPWKQGN